MQKIKAKLNSKRGVSLLLALLLFLLCALSGAAALTAAGSNIGRYSYMIEYQQEYLSVSSAAKLLKAQFEQGTSITADCSTGTAVVNYGGLTNGDNVYGLMTGEIDKLLNHVYKTKSGDSTVSYAPAEVKFDVVADGFETVKVTVNKIKLDGETAADTDVELTSGEHTLVFTVNFEFGYEPTTKILTITKADVERITLPKSVEVSS